MAEVRNILQMSGRKAELDDAAVYELHNFNFNKYLLVFPFKIVVNETTIYSNWKL